jgi:HSP20 family protein
MRQLIPFDPFKELSTNWGEDVFTGSFSGAFLPAVDIYQEGDNVIVEMEMPGVKTEQVDVSVENDVLTISAKKEEKKEVKKEDYYHKEIRKGSFSRSVILPMKVKGEESTAEVSAGVLRVVLPKADELKPKKIQVKSVKKEK